MLRNYFIITFRRLLKNRAISLINVSGLSIGLACVITLVAYVRLELSYDKFHSKSEDTYRITTDWINDGSHEHSAQTFSALAPILNENLTGLAKAVRILPHTGLVSMDKVNKQRESRFCFVDSTFFDVFDFQVKTGTLAGALDNPYALVVTEAAAIRYFGTTDVLEKDLYFEDNRMAQSFHITAVIKDMPQNSHFKVEFMASFSSLQNLWPSAVANWYYPPMYLYIQMTGGQSIESIDTQLKTIAGKHLPDYVQEEKRTFLAQKITDIHLQSALQNEWEANSNREYVNLFSMIAAFILFIACINYMNLSTARSSQRAAEVGIRKTMGSARNQLVRMFLTESLVTAVVAFVLALLLVNVIAIPFFKDQFQIELSYDFLFHGFNSLYLLAAILLISLCAGLYPALFMSSFRPLQALKGNDHGAGSVLGLRKGLVVFQFFISAFLLVSVFVVIRQIDYLRNKSLGFDKDHVVTITLSDRESQQNYNVLKDLLLRESFVRQATVSASLPAGEDFYGWEVVPEGLEDRKNMILKTVSSDEDFIKTYDIKIVAGRDFSKDILTDKEQAFILNQAAAKKFEWDNPIGKEFQLTFYTNDNVIRKGKVIGVVEDFHFRSLYHKIEPLVMFINTHWYYTDFLSVKLAPGNIHEQVERLKGIWTSFNPDKPFEFAFLDDELDKLYQTEQRTSSLLAAFTGLSIFISCLGLFGLTSFSVQQRTKEIGIRKVLGASVFSLLKLLTKEFVLLVLVGNVIAWPLAWYGTSQWLNKFAYRIDVELAIFLVAGGAILLIAIITVGIKAMRTALMNPVDSLRYE